MAGAGAPGAGQASGQTPPGAAPPPGGGPVPSPSGDWTAGIQQKPFSEQKQEEEGGDDASPAPEVVDETAEASVVPPGPDAPCALCPGGAADPDASASFQGRSMGCGEFDGILASNGVAEGTGLCGNYRSQFSGVCCSTSPAGGESEGGEPGWTTDPASGVEEEDVWRPDQQLNGFDATSWYTESERSGSQGSAPAYVPLVFVAALFLLER